MARASAVDEGTRYRFPWVVTLTNRYSKRLVDVLYYDNESEARDYARQMRGGDYIVKVGKA